MLPSCPTSSHRATVTTPFERTPEVGLDAGWWGSWVGPRGGATPGTYAVICYRHSGEGWRPVGVAGPVEVR